MDRFLRMLEEGYEATSRNMEAKISRLEFLGDYIFDFTTYDGEITELFATKALEVCAAITEGKTFEYIKDPDRYRWYLLMCNMPFFVGRLDWGTSIRGAWWNPEQPDLDTSGLWLEGKQLSRPLRFAFGDWGKFMQAVNKFSGRPLVTPSNLVA